VLILLFGAPDIVNVLYGQRWNESIGFLRFLTIYSLVWPYVSLGLWLSVALGHGRATLIFTGTQAITLIGLGTPLTIGLGISGTLVGVALTMLVAFSLSCRYIFRQVPLTPAEAFGPSLVAACIAFLALLGVSYITGWQELLPVVRLIVIIGIATGVFFAALYALRPSELSERIRYLRRSFRP
jgi:O-antigen/teichoic acid export membrane protein